MLRGHQNLLKKGSIINQEEIKRRAEERKAIQQEMDDANCIFYMGDYQPCMDPDEAHESLQIYQRAHCEYYVDKSTQDDEPIQESKQTTKQSNTEVKQPNDIKSSSVSVSSVQHVIVPARTIPPVSHRLLFNTVGSDVSISQYPQHHEQKTSLKDDLYKELKLYRSVRDNKHEYYSIWAKLFGMSRTLKLQAVDKMLDLLDGKPIAPFTDDELEALRNKSYKCGLFSNHISLGDIICKYEKLGALPKQFTQAENARIIRDARLLRG